MTNSNFVCSDCGENFPKWVGKCSNCKNWNTVKEFRETKIINSTKKIHTGQNLAKDCLQKNETKIVKISSKIEEIDRVLGEGGFVQGSLVLLSGSPGVGKSTMALQIFLNLNQTKKCLYFSGEESREQILHRSERFLEKENNKNFAENIFVTNSLEDIITTVSQNKPDFIIVDSIQMVSLKNASFGGQSTIRETAEVLQNLAKKSEATILLIGHITKNEDIAGPKMLEHLVDTVLFLEGEKDSEVRILRSPKNRFSSTAEIGVLEMRENGLGNLENPSAYFLKEKTKDSSGSAITVVREGLRNFLMEIQTLTLKTNFGNPRRTSHGINIAKFHLLLAVVSKFTPFNCTDFDAYLNVVNNFRVNDPSADLCIVSAILSSRIEKNVPNDTVILGEVGLSGEVRSVKNLDSRILEAEKLGFSKIIIPKIRNRKNLKTHKIKIIEISSITEIIKNLWEN